MGLDMYVRYRDKPTDGEPYSEVDFNTDWQDEEIHYWRKHPNLHGWFQKLYYKKGGGSRVFNGNVVAINENDLNLLEEIINNDKLPNATGYYFGTSSDNREDDLEFIRKARGYLKSGFLVYYNSSW